MKSSAFLCCLTVLLLCQLVGARKSSGTKVNKIKGPTEREFSIDDATLTLDIEHSIGGGKEFHPRGKFYLKSLKSALTMSLFVQLPLTLPNTVNRTNIAVAAEYGGFYFIRVRSKFTDLLSNPGGCSDGNTTSSEYVSTLISACALVKAHLSDLIIINGDGQGNIIGLTLTTPMTIAGTDCKEIDEDLLPTHFNTFITIDNGLVGPMPDTKGYCQKVEEEEREKEEEKSKPSFLQKYWVYIVFGFSLLMFLNPPGTLEGGGGGAGGQQ